VVIGGLAFADGSDVDALDERLDKLAPHLPRERLIQAAMELAQEIADRAKVILALTLMQKVALDPLDLVPHLGALALDQIELAVEGGLIDAPAPEESDHFVSLAVFGLQRHLEPGDRERSAADPVSTVSRFADSSLSTEPGWRRKLSMSRQMTSQWSRGRGANGIGDRPGRVRGESRRSRCD
jgi:hypothetical protein